MRSSLGAPLTMLAAVGAMFAACALPGTGGEAIEVRFSVAAVPAQNVPLGVMQTSGASPWMVELHEARLVIGAIYVFPPPAEVRRILPRLFTSRALAHPGDDNLLGMPAVAEHREQVVVDALSSEAIDLGPSIAEASVAATISVYLDEPRGALAQASGPTRGFHAWVSGVARRGAEVVAFESGLDIENTPLRRRVDGISIEGQPRLTSGSHIALGVRADRWLRDVDFDRLLEVMPDSDGVIRPVAPSQYHNAWYLGVHNPGAFAAEITEGQ